MNKEFDLTFSLSLTITLTHTLFFFFFIFSLLSHSHTHTLSFSVYDKIHFTLKIIRKHFKEKRMIFKFCNVKRQLRKVLTKRLYKYHSEKGSQSRVDTYNMFYLTCLTYWCIECNSYLGSLTIAGQNFTKISLSVCHIYGPTSRAKAAKKWTCTVRILPFNIYFITA